jgi:hypothetical protein
MRQVMGDLINSRDRSGDAFDDETLAAMVAERVRMLEAVAVVFFAEAVAQLPNRELPDDARIDPYAVSLDPGRWEADGVFGGDGLTVAEATERTAGLKDALEALRAGQGAPVGGPPGGGPPGGPGPPG